MHYEIQDICLVFFLYAFLGWCLEVAFCGIKEGHFINRGFLNGPLCPIYGVGAAVVVLCLTPLKGNIVLLYVCSVVITSALELIAGAALEKIYHVRWWDYSNEKFNLGGYICLSFSLAWGIACIALMYVIQPLLYDLVIYHIGNTVKTVIVSALGAMLIADLIATVNTLKELNLRVKQIDKIALRLHEISDEIGKNVYDSAEKLDDLRDRAATDERVIRIRNEAQELNGQLEQESRRIKTAIGEARIRLDQKSDEYEEAYRARIQRLKDEMQELYQKREKLFGERKRLQERIIKSFPNMRHKRYSEGLSKLKEHIKLHKMNK